MNNSNPKTCSHSCSIEHQDVQIKATVTAHSLNSIYSHNFSNGSDIIHNGIDIFTGQGKGICTILSNGHLILFKDAKAEGFRISQDSSHSTSKGKGFKEITYKKSVTGPDNILVEINCKIIQPNPAVEEGHNPVQLPLWRMLFKALGFSPNPTHS